MPVRPAGAAASTARLAELQLAVLHRAMRDTFSPQAASTALAEAGRRAAAELLRTIPPSGQALRRDLPRHVATALLLDSLGHWAPLFAAERRFTAHGGERPVLVIAANPLCDDAPLRDGAVRGRRVCAWHEALFETLFQALVAPGTRVRETACLALGDPVCRFEVSFEGE
jgi:divinyl protochlorophyllide a 8-vinyl-reductase